MKRLTLAITVLLLTALACNLPNTQDQVPDAAFTAAAQTLAVELTSAAKTQAPPAGQTSAPGTSTATVTNTPSPTATTTSLPPTITATTIPCNAAQFIQDVNYPDGAEVVTGQSFTKTWRFKNTGTCAWTSGYQLVFDHGDQMSAPASQSLTSASVPSGGTVDVSVNLVAPATKGNYKGYWRFREPGGVLFGLVTGAFWVDIKAVNPDLPSPTPTEPVTLVPDLYVSEFTLSPATPIQGQPVHVRIGVYNKGTAAAGAYVVNWFGLSTFPSPSCTWPVDKTNAKGGRILECDFTFASWYPKDKISLVVVDANNQVTESDESNNQGTITPFGVDKP
jgi:hypothetical protein